MPRRLAQKLMLSLTVIVVIVAAVSGILHIKTEERQLLNAMTLGADQLSKAITSATWHAMLADHRENAYQVMQTIALKQGIDRIRMFNRGGQVMFSTRPEENNTEVDQERRDLRALPRRLRAAGQRGHALARAHLPAAPTAAAAWPWSRPSTTSRRAARPPATRTRPT